MISRAAIHISCAVLALLACGDDKEPAKPDLPPGWSDAERIDEFVQMPCSGSIMELNEEHAEVDIASDAIQIDYLKAHFRCSQDVEGFVRREGDYVDVLVQPVDISPELVAGCDCLYTIRMELPPLAAPQKSVRVYRRWDGLNDENKPVLIENQ